MKRERSVSFVLRSRFQRSRVIFPIVPVVPFGHRPANRLQASGFQVRKPHPPNPVNLSKLQTRAGNSPSAFMKRERSVSFVLRSRFQRSRVIFPIVPVVPFGHRPANRLQASGFQVRKPHPPNPVNLSKLQTRAGNSPSAFMKRERSVSFVLRSRFQRSRVIFPIVPVVPFGHRPANRLQASGFQVHKPIPRIL